MKRFSSLINSQTLICLLLKLNCLTPTYVVVGQTFLKVYELKLKI